MLAQQDLPGESVGLTNTAWLWALVERGSAVRRSQGPQGPGGGADLKEQGAQPRAVPLSVLHRPKACGGGGDLQ